MEIEVIGMRINFDYRISWNSPDKRIVLRCLVIGENKKISQEYFESIIIPNVLTYERDTKVWQINPNEEAKCYVGLMIFETKFDRQGFIDLQNIHMVLKDEFNLIIRLHNMYLRKY